MRASAVAATPQPEIDLLPPLAEAVQVRSGPPFLTAVVSDTLPTVPMTSSSTAGAGRP